MACTKIGVLSLRMPALKSSVYLSSASAHPSVCAWHSSAGSTPSAKSVATMRFWPKIANPNQLVSETSVSVGLALPQYFTSAARVVAIISTVYPAPPISEIDVATAGVTGPRAPPPRTASAFAIGFEFGVRAKLPGVGGSLAAATAASASTRAASFIWIPGPSILSEIEVEEQ